MRPRAREIDETRGVPAGPVRACSATPACSGCASPRSTAARAPGILGLTHRHRGGGQVLEHRRAHAAAHPAAHRAGDDRRRATSRRSSYLRPHRRRRRRARRSACPSRRPAATSWACAPRRCRDGDDWVLNGTKCWMSGVRAGRLVHACSPRPADDVTRRKHDSITAFIVERALGRRRGRHASTARWACGASTPASCCCTTCGCRPRTSIGEIGGFRLAMLGLNSMRPDRRGPRHRAGRGRAHVRDRVREAARGVQQDHRRLPGHPVGDRQAGDRDRGGPPAHLPRGVDGRPGPVHQGVGALPVDGQVLRHRAGGEGVERVRCRCSARPAT